MTTPNRPPLSPAAQAVMIAATNGNTNVINDPVYRQCIAAALRAAVLQAVPRVSTAADRASFAPILAIAAELESTSVDFGRNL